MKVTNFTKEFLTLHRSVRTVARQRALARYMNDRRNMTTREWLLWQARMQLEEANAATAVKPLAPVRRYT